MVQVGGKAIVFLTHSHNASNPIWTVVRVSKTGKQIILEKGQERIKATLRSGGYYAPTGCQYSQIEFEGSLLFDRCAERVEEEVEITEIVVKDVMPYAASELLDALKTFVHKFEEGEPITPENYADAKNAIAREQGKPLPFLERYVIEGVRHRLERLVQ